MKDENCFIEIVKKSFNQRRKTIKKSLESKKFDIKKILTDNKINPSLRPEELDYNNFIKLSNSISNFNKRF